MRVLYITLRTPKIRKWSQNAYKLKLSLPQWSYIINDMYMAIKNVASLLIFHLSFKQVC